MAWGWLECETVALCPIIRGEGEVAYLLYSIPLGIRAVSGETSPTFYSEVSKTLGQTPGQAPGQMWLLGITNGLRKQRCASASKREGRDVLDAQDIDRMSL